MSELNLQSQDVGRWTKRWLERGHETVIQRLSDFPRSGVPDKIHGFTGYFGFIRSNPTGEAKIFWKVMKIQCIGGS